MRKVSTPKESRVLPVSLANPREPRERKQRGPPEDGVPSKTKVMVANLPYDLREEKLMELFSEYSPSSAKIALRPIPRFMVKIKKNSRLVVKPARVVVSASLLSPPRNYNRRLATR